tara:strand:- start:401 stop:784 length:384 start_codon:yes stop_codon:yes gene_type:complete
MIRLFKILFYISLLLLIIFSLYPGNLFGSIFYGDSKQRLNLTNSLFAGSLNHFIYYVYISLLGFFLYLNTEEFKKIVFSLFFLAIILELIHLVLPQRTFQFLDIFGNIFGVIIAYCILKIYLLFNKS